jgi:hypothetical protein
MAISPRVVTADRHITWDGVVQRLPKGQQIDVPPGSPLERAIGAEFLVPLPGSVAAQVPAEAVAPKEEPAPAKPRPAAKKDDDGKDGGQ